MQCNNHLRYWISDICGKMYFSFFKIYFLKGARNNQNINLSFYTVSIYKISHYNFNIPEIKFIQFETKVNILKLKCFGNRI